MKKKILIYFFIFTLIFPFSFIKPNKASANPMAKIVVGSTAEKIMVGIGEKAGVKTVTKSARDRALQKWNFDFHNLDKINDAEIKARVEAFRKQLDTAEVIPMPDKPGWSKVIISTGLFITGADLIYDAVTAFENAKDKAAVEEVLADDYASGNMYTSGVTYHIFAEGDTQEQWGMYYVAPWLTNIANSQKAIDKGTGMNYYRITDQSENIISIVAVFTGLFNGKPVISEVPTYIERKKMPADHTIVEVFTPSPLEIPDYNIPQVLQPLKDTAASPISNPEMPTLPYEEIEILIPDGPLANPSPEYVPENLPIEDDGKDPLAPTEPGTDPGTETPTEPGTDPGTETPTEPGTDPGTETPTEPGNGDGSGDTGNPVKKINWPKLKAIPMAFTTAFPFSLPWDVARGLDATFGSIDEQTGPIEFVWNVYKETTPITFTVPEMFLDWFKYIRSFVLIIFDITFIYAVRKLLGGAS